MEVPDGEQFCPADGTALKPEPVDGLSNTALGPAHVHDTPYVGPPPGAQDAEDPLIGRVLGGLYRITSRLGCGGMGVVYVGEHVHLGKRFAIKMLNRQIAANASAIDRLRIEAISASRIEHDNIVDIVSFDKTPEGDVFVVMELLKGQNLAEVIAEGPLPLARALDITLQVSRALGAAHETGIIHRDVKPENLFLCKKEDRDFVKVLDFGISKVKDAENARVRMTKTGELVGTPLYMSPEQARGETTLDARVDVYSLGVILFEMLIGKPPFTGENYFQLLWKHTNQEAPSLRSSRSGLLLPPALETIVARALAKDPENRFASMKELYDAVAEVALEEGLGWLVHGTVPSGVRLLVGPRRSRKVIWSVVAAVLLGAATLLVVWPRPRTDAPDRPVSKVRNVPAGPDAAVERQPRVVPVAPPVPEAIVVALASTPAGADVFRGETRVGATPTFDRVPRSQGAIRYRFILRGYREVEREVVPNDDLNVQVRLPALGRPRYPSGFQGSPPVGDFQGSPPVGDFQGSPPVGDFQGSSPVGGIKQNM